MKKSKIALSMALVLASSAASAATMTAGTFTMLDATGGLVGSVDTAVTGSIGSGVWAVASTTTFFGTNWTAHSGTTFGPGTYTWNTGAGSYTGVVVGAGQVGGHILFDHGVNLDIDIVQVWDITNGGLTYTNTDITGLGSGSTAGSTVLGPDGILGLGMYEAFPGFNANFDFTVSAVPVPAAVWLFGSGLLGLVGVARRKKAA